MEKWRIYLAGAGKMTPVQGQPDDGFVGPGTAVTWLRGHDANLFNRLGTDVIVVRDDGARPMTNTKGGRQYVDQQAEPKRHVRRRPELLGAKGAHHAAPAGPLA